jgi:hypothetical protein
MAKGIKTRSPFAAKQRQLVPVEDLTGGVDLRRSPTLLGSNRARQVSNFGIGEQGALTVNPGQDVVSSAAFGTVRASGGARIYTGSTAFTLVAIDGAVYKPSDVWVRGAAVYSTISTGNQTFFPYDRDLVMVMDGANRPRFSTNGTNWHLAGIDAPSSAAVLSSVQSGGGALSTGEYEVVYTYKHRGTAHESNPSSGSTITLTASTANSIHSSASPSTDPKVDAYVWYARHKLPDQETILRKVSSGSASTYTILSSAWTANDEAPSNHNVPVVGLRFGVSWKSRWWAPSGTIGNRLYFTELFLPQAWPSLYFIDIPFEKGDSIAAIHPLGDTLMVYGQSGVFLIIGQTSLDFEVRPSQGAEAGAFGPRAVARVEQASIHASGDGVDSFDGASDRSLEHDIQPAWRDLVANSAGADVAKVAMVYDGLTQQVRIAVPRVYPTAAAGEWILNLTRTRDQDGVPAWTTTTRIPAFYIHWNGNEPTAGNRGRLFYLPASTTGLVHELLDATTTDGSDNSSNITAEYEGPALSFGLHQTRVVGTFLEYEPQPGACSIDLLVDGVAQGSQAIDISGGVKFYGDATVTYGTASRTYGGAVRKKSPLVTWPLRASGHTAVAKAVYVGQNRFRIFGYTHVIVPEPAPRNL